MKPAERKIAGVWCSEVLAHLSEYVDGELTADQVDGINAHLRACDWCEAFGGGFSTVVAELRRELQEPEPLNEDVRERLWKRLVRAGWLLDQGRTGFPRPGWGTKGWFESAPAWAHIGDRYEAR